MVPGDRIAVEVVYALPDKQVLRAFEVAEGTTVAGAISLSGIQNEFPGIDLAVNKVGIFGKLAKPEDVLRAGDRVEIYRPLIADPKEIRRQRAAQGKVTKKGSGRSNN